MTDALGRGKYHVTTDTQRKCHVMTKAEIGVTLLEGKECQSISCHQETGSGKKGFSPESQRKHGPADTLTRFLASRENKFHCFKPHSSSSPKKLIQNGYTFPWHI